MRQNSRQAFTLIELLVVISIIALLISILLPALSRTRYSAKISQCLSAKRQWGMSIYAYAVDHDGDLPSYDIPVTGRNPWDVSPQFTDAMIDYGINNPELWFCAADTAVREHIRAFAPTIGADDVLTDLDDMKLYYERWKPTVHTLGLSCWVPRSVGGVVVPTIDGTTTNPEGRPTSLEDPRLGLQPVLTDTVAVNPSTGYTSPHHRQPNRSRQGCLRRAPLPVRLLRQRDVVVRRRPRGACNRCRASAPARQPADARGQLARVLLNRLIGV